MSWRSHLGGVEVARWHCEITKTNERFNIPESNKNSNQILENMSTLPSYNKNNLYSYTLHRFYVLKSMNNIIVNPVCVYLSWY